MDFDPAALRTLRETLLGGPEPDWSDRIVSALSRAYAASQPAGHQATAAERSAAYERYTTLRNQFYGQPPGREQVRNSLAPDGASPLIRRIFGRD